jgi:hypothetical protein
MGGVQAWGALREARRTGWGIMKKKTDLVPLSALEAAAMDQGDDRPVVGSW